MLDFISHSLEGGRGLRYVLRRDSKPVSYRDVLRFWQNDESFRILFIATLAAAPFEGYRWETPPIDAGRSGRDFEFVLLDTPGLARAPDDRAFAEQFRGSDSKQRVIAFANLGNDAMLIVPQLCGDASAYVHLAAFVRHAPSEQVHELWRLVGQTLAARLNSRPIWLSTAGMGVSWLHVRLDSRPKYYGFAAYREGSA